MACSLERTARRVKDGRWLTNCDTLILFMANTRSSRVRPLELHPLLGPTLLPCIFLSRGSSKIERQKGQLASGEGGLSRVGFPLTGRGPRRINMRKHGGSVSLKLRLFRGWNRRGQKLSARALQARARMRSLGWEPKARASIGQSCEQKAFTLEPHNFHPRAGR